MEGWAGYGATGEHMMIFGYRCPSAPCRAFLAAMALSMISAPVAASSTSFGTITGLLPHSGGLFFNQTATRTAVPACATVTGRWVINVGSIAGQMKASALLTAYSLHKRISVYGNNTCDTWGDTETVEFFVVED
jgi:hypothetical protein